MSLRHLLALAALAGVPQLATAQFTAFIPPKSVKVVDTVKAPVVVVAEKKVQADTAAAIRISNMKAWVDSAAGTMSGPARAADSLNARTHGARSPVAKTSGARSPGAATRGADSSGAANRRADAAVFRDGSRAPATASSLPLIALLGASALGLGLVLLGRPRTTMVARDVA